MPRILVTNDDGVHSEGIRSLARAMEAIGEVTIVAPLGESSAIAHALTLTRPLRLERISEHIWGVDGTPTDCVNLAVVKVLDGLPDLVVSGVNLGYNLGDDVTYSGTVAGAMEGALLGVPGVAVSLGRSRVYDFRQSVWAARIVAESVLQHGLPTRTFLNVNVPKVAAKGFRVTTQAHRTQMPAVREGEDPRGKKYYWIEEVVNNWLDDGRSDYQAVMDGWISVTPLQPDLTNHAALETIEAFSIDDATRLEAVTPLEATPDRS